MTNPKYSRVEPRDLLHDPILFLAFGFGSGLAPKAPGTFGTLVAVPVFWWLSSFSSSVYLLITLVLAGVGVWLCERAAKTLGVHDHSGIVWDEIVGLLLTLFLAPPGWAWLVTGFVLFRFFDIVKPWPIRWLDRRVKGGLGIMLDDVVAALFAWLVLQLLAFWLLP